MGTETAEGNGGATYLVDMSVRFAQIYATMPANQANFVDGFMEHFEKQGIEGLQGRFKKSDNVPTDDPFWLQKVKYAQANLLWHYHIGYPSYDETKSVGDWTSQYILHVTLTPCKSESVLVGWGRHPPFILPSLDDLKV